MPPLGRERIAAEHPAPLAAESAASSDPVLRQIREQLRGLKFGTVSVVIQDGVVVQLERTEKTRPRRHSVR